jgi:histidine triad (HIT) family protein
MASIFTMIIDGDIPGHFVYRDDRCVAFLSIEPLTEGHTLVVPVPEVDHWIDLDPDLAGHLMRVAQRVGKAIDTLYSPRRVGLMIVGDEVPHAHIHVMPINSVRDLDFANARPASSDELARVAGRLAETIG